MPKRNLKTEKAARNELFSDKFKKNKTDKKRSPWLTWCRVDGHPSSCSCILPSREEVLSLTRRK